MLMRGHQLCLCPLELHFQSWSAPNLKYLDVASVLAPHPIGQKEYPGFVMFTLDANLSNLIQELLFSQFLLSWLYPWFLTFSREDLKSSEGFVECCIFVSYLLLHESGCSHCGLFKLEAEVTRLAFHNWTQTTFPCSVGITSVWCSLLFRWLHLFANNQARSLDKREVCSVGVAWDEWELRKSTRIPLATWSFSISMDPRSLLDAGLGPKHWCTHMEGGTSSLFCANMLTNLEKVH